MANAYNPIAVESAWYDWWDAQGFFQPQLDPETGKPKKEGLFIIPAPPPNVTGSLHIGHGLTTAIQDALIRWNRMLGKTTLFVPGFDHAGISTQAVVEGRIWKLEGKTRHDYGRDAFLEKIWAWKDEYVSAYTCYRAECSFLQISSAHFNPITPTGRKLRLVQNGLHYGRGPLEGSR